jgi:hypothetical protein
MYVPDVHPTSQMFKTDIKHVILIHGISSHFAFEFLLIPHSTEIPRDRIALGPPPFPEQALKE